MTDYDAWLERPYVEQAAQQDRVERFAENNEMPLETDDDWTAASEALAAAEEDAAEAAAEARWERQMWDRD
jgi:hypothetical protein